MLTIEVGVGQVCANGLDSGQPLKRRESPNPSDLGWMRRNADEP
jgi:hypothetical protein